MSPAVRLGLRLAVGASRVERTRAVLTVVGAALAVDLLLAAVGVSQAIESGGVFEATGLRRLGAAMIAVVGLPALILVATIGRLSASIRDRRLATLRLLGLTPGRTRVLAAVEVGATAVVGTLLGALTFPAVRWLLATISPAGQDWGYGDLAPAVWQWAAVLIAVPVTAMAVAVAPTRDVSRSALAVAHSAPTRRPGLWRAIPLALGIALLWWGLRQQGDNISTREIVTLFGGGLLTAVGVVLVVPVLLSLVAAALAHWPRPSAMLASRRLQLEPSSTSRLISALLIGLFVVAGARCVLVAFEQTPQYQSSHAAVTEGPQYLDLNLPSDRAEKVEHAILGVAGVRDVISRTTAWMPCMGPGEPCMGAVVTSCAELAVIYPGLTGCRDDQVLWNERVRFGRTGVGIVHAGEPLTFTDGPGRDFTVPAPGRSQRLDGTEFAPLMFDVFVPRAMVDTGGGDVRLMVVTGPGRSMADRIDTALFAAGFENLGWSSYNDFEYMDFVDRMRTILWTIAAVVLGIGLLSFGLASVDRALERRRQVVALRVVGTPMAVVRRAQLLQSLLPLGIGIPLAVCLGWLCGTTYLSLGGIPEASPWQSMVTLAAIGLVCAAVVSLGAVVAIGRTIPAELLRRE